ncbi:MAG: hypothetical protein ABEJ08_01785 [Halobacteriaceae archaeon]
MRRDRGQLSTPLVEAGLGLLFVFAVAAGFVLGAPDAGVEDRQLDRYAGDAVTLLAEHGLDGAPLAAAIDSPAALSGNESRLRDRLDRLLPAGLRGQLRTPAGVVGPPPPAGRAVGTATVSTTAGPVRVRVWYA